MSTAEYERLGEIRDHLEDISNALSALYVIGIFAAAWVLYHALKNGAVLDA